MARKNRIISKTGMYHIYFFGNGREGIFTKAGDYEKFIEILKKHKSAFSLYAYSLSEHDGHLFLKTDDISLLMKRILTDYAMWFNRKYNRKGTLFASRYKSEPIDDALAVGLTRYIVNQGGCNCIDEYKKGGDALDGEYILSKFNSLDEFLSFVSKKEAETYGADKSENTAETKLMVKNVLNGAAFRELSYKERTEVVEKLTKLGMTKSSIARYVGVSRATVVRAITLQNASKKAEIKRKNAEVVLL